MNIRNSPQAVQQAFFGFWHLSRGESMGQVIQRLEDKFPGLSPPSYTQRFSDAEQLNRIYGISRSGPKPDRWEQLAPPIIGEGNTLKVMGTVGWGNDVGKEGPAKSRVDVVAPSGSIADWESYLKQWLNDTRPGSDTIQFGAGYYIPIIVGWTGWYE